MQLVADHAGGAAALSLTAGGEVSAVDLYKHLPNHDELYYAGTPSTTPKVKWHHSGVWIGGYNPALPYANPQAGRRPRGDDRFSISIEPVYDIAGAQPRFDTYDYWMGMHSWMAAPVDNGQAWACGNGLIHRRDFTVNQEQWTCLELHARLNPDATSGAGAVLEVWKNDAPVIRYRDGERGRAATGGATSSVRPARTSRCADYQGPDTDRVNLQMRSTPALAFNAF